MNNSVTISLVIGMPGSGKSFYLSNASGIIFDDISQISDGINHLKEKINLKENQIIYISDVNFCDIKILKKAQIKIQELVTDKTREIKFKYVIFKSTEKICINNVAHRNDGRNVLPTIKRFSSKLDELIIFLTNEQHKDDILLINTPIMPLNTSSSKLKII